MSLTDLPASCWCRMETICASENLFFFIIEPFKLENFSNLEWSNFGGAYTGRRISIWLFVFNFNFIFSIGQRFRAGHYKISHLQQYLLVVRQFDNSQHS